jgi:hypothetical protein
MYACMYVYVCICMHECMYVTGVTASAKGVRKDVKNRISDTRLDPDVCNACMYICMHVCMHALYLCMYLSANNFKTHFEISLDTNGQLGMYACV